MFLFIVFDKFKIVVRLLASEGGRHDLYSNI